MSLTAWNRNSSLSLQSLVYARNSLPFVELEVRQTPLTSPNLLVLSQSGDLKSAHLLALSDCLFSTVYQKTTLCRDSSVGIERERAVPTMGRKFPSPKLWSSPNQLLNGYLVLLAERQCGWNANLTTRLLLVLKLRMTATTFQPPCALMV